MSPEQHLENVRELAELKTQVNNIASDVTTIVHQLEAIGVMQRSMVRLEQEQVDHKEALGRAFGRIENTEKFGLDIKSSTEKWINRGIGAWAVGALLLAIIQTLILDRVKGYEANQIATMQQLVNLDRRLTWAEYEVKRGKRTEADK